MGRKSKDLIPPPAVAPRRTTGQGAQVFWGALSLLVVIGVATYVRIEHGEDFHDATTSAACIVTGCSGSGMALAGWFLAITPLLFMLALARWFATSSRRNKIIWIVAGCALTVAVIQFLPGRSGPDLDEMLNSPGGGALASGLTWGIGSMVVGLVVLGAFTIALPKLKNGGPAAVIAVVLVLLAGGGAAAATAEGDDVYLMTTDIFPETTVRVQDDVLTRTSATDLDGCGGDYDNCLRTAEFDFTTTDSDAVVNLRVISFPDNDAAWDAWHEVKTRTGDPALLREGNVTGEWLLVSTVRHADSRPIQAADEKWLRWPAAQLEYAFRRAIDYSLLYEPRINETQAPKG